MLKHFINITIILSLIVFYSKAFAQIDTLNYLKQFEVNKAAYQGQNFSALYRKLKVKPQTFSHFLSMYSSSSIFYIKKGVALRIEWLDSPYSYLNQEINFENCDGITKCTLTEEIKIKLGQLRIKNLDIIEPEKFVRIGDLGQLKPVKNISKFLNDKLSGTPPLQKNISFADLLIRIRPLSPILIKNIFNHKNKISESLIKFAFREKSISKDTINLEVKWKYPIKYKGFKDTKSDIYTIFTDEYYTLYWEEKIKNIKVIDGNKMD